MSQATMAPATTIPDSSTIHGNGNGNGNVNVSKREAKGTTAIEAITKITKVLDQLTPSDRKRVLAFVNESNVE